MVEYLEIGKIVNTHGTKGELKVIPLTDAPSRYYELEWVYIGNQNINNIMGRYNVESVRIAGSNIIIKFAEINDMNSAQLLKGLFIKVDREHAVKLPEDTFFICDLIGSEVYDENSGKKLGVIGNIIKTGSNDVYEVNTEDKKVLLVPALKSVVKKVLLKEKKVWVLLPEGLVDNDF
ncbi:MAG: 16S rRNA processing protein RimM [Clostridiaceae bacterium]|nr:16S rRNA processing protein RimM [Clostridiaceae bacterium]